MIDTHCHILPGVDDGAKTMDEAVAMARIAAADGIKVIVATPHWNVLAAPPDPADIRQRVQELQERLDAEGIGVRILPGAEIALIPDLVEAADELELPRLGDSEFILVEALPYLTWEAMRHLIFELQIRGHHIVLAHPERATPILEDYSRVEHLHSAGVRLQVVATAFARRWGNSVARVARRLVKERLADLLASDAHNAQQQPPKLTSAQRLVERLGGRDMFQALTQKGPAEILNSHLQEDWLAQ